MLEQVFIARGDHLVIHEPFGRAYYHGPDRVSSDFLPISGPDSRFTFKRILEELLKAEHENIFVKDMAYHAIDHVDDAIIAHFKNCFVIRNPRAALPSLFDLNPLFTMAEAGYSALYRMYVMSAEIDPQPIIIEAEELLSEPHKTVKDFCEKLGIEFLEASLTWKPAMNEQWGIWPNWHKKVAESTHISSDFVTRRDFPSQLVEQYAECRRYYDLLRVSKDRKSRRRHS